MKNSIFLFFILVAGCGSPDQSKGLPEIATNDSTSVAENDILKPSVVSGCYAWNIKRDSAGLKLNISGDKVTGDLMYRLYEKDKNTGKIEGIVRDSLISGYYTYQSEGMTSVREVVFKMNGDFIIEGFGDIVMYGDTAKFKDRSQLQFNNDRPFVKINCDSQK